MTITHNNTVFSSLLLMFIVGSVIALAHYIPPPPPELVISANIQPGPEWFTDQMARYADNAVISFIHVIPAFIFMIIASVQVWPGFRQRNKNIHQLLGKIFVANAMVITASALYLGIMMPYAGLSETIVTSAIATSFMVALIMGVMCIKRNNIAGHREWMSRTLAIGMSPVSMRFIFGAILTYYPDTDSTTVFAPTMWAGLIVNLIVVEAWLRHTRIDHSPPLVPGH